MVNVKHVEHFAFVLGAVCCLSIITAIFTTEFRPWAIGCAALSGVGAIVCVGIYYSNKSSRVNARRLTTG